jgi:glycosyltransferase involved in cell wall biosynthesis
MLSSTRRTSVAVVTDAIHPYHRGGKEIRYSQLLPRLQESLDIRVYTMHWWPERSTKRTEQGVECQAICPLFSLYHKARRSMLEATAFAFACLRLVAKRFDVVEADHMPYLQLFTLRLVTELRQRPLVVTWNEVWGPEYWGRYLGRVSGPIAWWIERTAMSLPDQILAVSTGTAERLRSYVGDSVPIRVIHNAVDLDFIRGVEPARPEEAAELLFVGRLLKHKGVDLLIDAVATMKTDRPLRVLIVGDGPEKLNLEKQVAEMGLADVVRFRSDVADHTEVFALMKAAQVFVFPSLREGFGIAPLEALACGTRVVTTSHPDNQARHLVARSDRGYVTEATVEALAACIQEALADAFLGSKPTETWIEEFDWSAVAEEYRDALISSIASGHLRPRASGRVSASQMVQRKGTKQDPNKQAKLRAMRRYQSQLKSFV